MFYINKQIRKKNNLKLQKLFFILLIFFTLHTQAAMRSPSANRECASCHIMWLTEFKRQDVKTLIPYDPKPVMNSGKQDIASSEPICFSCHDGFVLDSRFLWEENKHAHPVGQKPSKKIQIPLVDGKNLFPLNDEGRMYCGTCHSAHGVDWSQKKTAVFMRVANENGQLCMACHKDKINGPKTGFHPLKRKIQKLLDKPPQHLMDAGARFAHDGEVICQSCHIPHAAPEKKLLLVKNDKSQLCGECHQSRYAKNRQHAGELHTHPVNIKPQNAEVPDDLLKLGGKLGSDGEVICQTCHRPHDAQPNTSLLVKENIRDSLCQDCHKDKRRVLDSKHDMRLVAKDSQNIRKQIAGESGPCSACHVPHKGTGPKMWARKRDLTQDPMASLCLSCHKKEGLAKKHTVGKYSHPVGAPVNKLKHAVALPTFNDNGFKWQDVEQGKVSCASCHNPHQWDPNDKNNNAEPGDKGNSSNRFLRIANTGPELNLCKACHKDKWSISNTKHDMNRMEPDAENILGQTVSESGMCGSCHLVHNAKGNRLWARADLTGANTGFVACLGCHNEKGLASKKTPGAHSHPINVDIKNLGITVINGQWSSSQENPVNPDSITGGAPIPLPLYNSEGRPVAENGQVGCGSCHDPHNWSTAKTTSSDRSTKPYKLEGNTANSFLRIPDQGLSRLCVNCHIEKKSVYFTKHDLTDQLGKDSTQLKENRGNNSQHLSGPCTACHRPHNAKGSAALWTRNKGPGKTAIAALCTDCHKKDGMAENRLPGEHTHPLGVDINKLPQNPQSRDKRIPTFNHKGERVNNGQVDCASCHNPHRWDPDNINNRSLPMLTENGNPSNSFLRLSANKNSKLCLSCHADKKTIIGTDHDLKHTAPGASNVLQQEESVSGLCGQCHIPHKATEDAYLWARQTGPGNDPIEKRCRSCHNPEGFAAHKNPEQAKHPQQIKIWSTETRKAMHPDKELPDTPVFNKKGKRSNFGSITCASCHNPHKWSATDKNPRKIKTGENPEGDALTSFLRTRNSENIVCSECHGADAIYRYKYFHSKSTHEKHLLFK